MPSSASRGIAIADARDDNFQFAPEFYRTVIVPCFPPDELETEEELIGGLRSGRSRLLLARDADGTIVGGAVGDYFPRSDVMLLAYLAVRPGGRGSGIGSTLLQAARDAWMAELNPRLIVLEVEDPRRVTGSAAFGDPVARVRFYERHGVRALPLPYVMPTLSPGTQRVQRLMLMVLGGAAVPPGSATADGQHVASFVAEYFEEFEGPARPGDSELGLLLAACARPGGLPLLRADELPAVNQRRGGSSYDQVAHAVPGTAP
jgi:GNAT superfamily N-acetyltransferase